MKEPQSINRLNDFFFKYMFGRDESKDILMSFLNSVLELEGENAITNLVIKNGELPADYIGDKLSRLDILAETASKTLINVEVQIANESNIIKRTVYYWTQMYKLDAGENYNKLCPAIMINILNFNLFPQRKRLHSNYSLYERGETERLTEDIEIHFIEIKKYQPDNKKFHHRLNKWLAYLSNTVSAEQMEAIAVGEPALQKALKMEKVFLTKTQERMIYENRQKAIQTYDATMEGRWEDGMNIGLRKGESIGLRKGRTEGKTLGLLEGEGIGLLKGKTLGLLEGESIGLRKGELKSKISLAKTMLQKGLYPEVVSDITGLSLSEINKL